MTKGVTKAVSTALTTGSKAPNFTLPDDKGGAVSLADFRGRKLVLYFYPKANTPGCTQQAMDFSRLKGAFEKAGTAVLGVSADPVRMLDKFRTKHDLSVGLASDESHTMLEAYGVWGQKSMFGKPYMGVIRTTVLIDAEGRIAKVWPKVKVPGHAQEVLEAAKAI